MAGDGEEHAGPRRVASVIALRPEHEHAYRDLHAAVWPEVLATITRCNIVNYSIYLHDGMLFSYFEYVGDDLEADMAAMAADPATQHWWETVKPLQRQLDDAPPGEWWTPVTEVFHLA